MPTFKLNKLVRDKIPELNKELGNKVIVRKLNVVELHKELVRKLAEEASELQSAESEEVAKELADIYEVLEALAKANGVSRTAINALRQRLRQSTGGFKKGYYISTLTIPDEDDKWVEYYRKDPKRFPEVK